MAELLEEPVNVRPDTEAWQQMLYKTTFVAGGYMDISLTNMSNDGAPQVMAGSRFELNGSLYYTEVNENIIAWNDYSNGTDLFIYAVPSGEGAMFVYGNGVPTYDPAKGGWYNGNNRALFKLYKSSSGGYTLKTPLIGPVMPVLQPVPFVEIFGVTNIDNINAPQVMAGSKFILNGKMINITADTSIDGSPVVGTDNYIYAVPSGEGATFSYGNSAPTYNPAKGGWYAGASRAVAVFWKNSGESYIGKKILGNTPEKQFPDFSQGAAPGTLTKMVTETGMEVIPKGAYRVVLVGAGGSAGSSAGSYDKDRPDAITGTGGSGSSGEMVQRYLILNQDTQAYIVCGGGGKGGTTPLTDSNGVIGKRGGNTELRISGEIFCAYGGAGGAAGARWTSDANALDGESSEVAVGGAGVKGNGDHTIGAPGTKRYSFINVGDGLQNGEIDPTAGRRGNTGGGINGRNGGSGGTYNSIDGGDGDLGCGGGSPFADTYGGSHGANGKAGNGGNGYVEFWRLA